MSVNRNPQNILLEHDCSLHEASDHCGQDGQPLYSLSATGNCNMSDYFPSDSKLCTKGHVTPNLSTALLHRNDGNRFPNREDCLSRTSCNDKDAHCPLTEYGERFSQKTSTRLKNGSTHKTNGTRLSSLRPTEYGEQFAPSVHQVPVNAKNIQSPNYIQQFKQGIFDSSCNDKQNARAGSIQSQQTPVEVENRNSEIRCSREKPVGTPFSCNDCREPQCLYCWRKWRNTASRDFSFLDGFETQESTWRPGKKIVDPFNGHYKEPNPNDLRRSTNHVDQMQSQFGNPRWYQNPCKPSCSQDSEEHKCNSKSNANKNTDFHEDREICNKSREESCNYKTSTSTSSIKPNEWQWALGKGRGMGPAPSEWVPPFRKYSEEHPLPQYQRGKGVGAMPVVDDWVPPFREGQQQQAYSWHRSRGTGDCHPKDQWLAPWIDSTRSAKMQIEESCNERQEGSCLSYQIGNKFWNGETREVY